MAFHFIAIANDYVQGRRLGWHYPSREKLRKERIQSFMNRVELECGDIQLGIHKFSTESKKWDSVLEKDSFFEDVIVTENEDFFIEQVSSGKELRAYDVAKYILSITPLTHLKLQKLLYYAYAEYLLATGEKLFKDPIVAFKYGPVVEDVFYQFRHNGSSQIDYKEDEVFFIHTKKAPPSFVRIISSDNGLIAAAFVLKTWKRYIDFTAKELVEKTHKRGGPWDRVYKSGTNQVISDDHIKKYHHVVQ
ncbi:Panacea domain-containing protein [Paenibacillus wynnii]|uniref:Antitoxin SocA-like Panacea domain-containing protein n=1 Tax=Paenibacillus wynnii TaxID=268407 RepID=A0A098M685_9BACL|nr:type II toxin-antitoxin system antitoxin SocA domain-containing protein [Paenibacillus wynnii]KGE17548.1 hypothetical protein PWYN_23390 [Paenibacillus wynnii]